MRKNTAILSDLSHFLSCDNARAILSQSFSSKDGKSEWVASHAIMDAGQFRVIDPGLCVSLELCSFGAKR